MITFLVILNICHWLADFTHLSTPWMLNAKRIGWPLIPILVHAACHALLFGLIATAHLGLIPLAGWIFAVQLITHFFIDVGKGWVNAIFPDLQTPANPYFWYVFGFDQLLHQIIIILTASVLTIK